MKRTKRVSILVLGLTVALATPQLADAPPLPASFYGAAEIDGTEAPPGTEVSAWIDGVQYAEAAAFAQGGRTRYVLHVPGDDPATAALEGGRDGDTIVFRLSDHGAAPTAVWHSGGHVELPLAAFSAPPPEITIDDVKVTEGDFGTTGAQFAVRLSAAVAWPVAVDFSTTNGTGGTSDYAATSGTLSFVPGTSRRNVIVRVKGDRLAESAETFYLDLENPSGATLADARGLGTIVDDDVLYVSIGDANAIERDGVTTQARFAVTLTGRSSGIVTVGYATADGSAAAGPDYEARTGGAVAFQPGETRKQITVPVFDDTRVEVDETFFVELTTSADAVLDRDRGKATILDDDRGRVPVVGTDVLYTEEVDFDQGTFQNLDPRGLDQVQLAAGGCGFRNLWIAASGRGTAVKIDTRSGTILGEFSTSPDTVQKPNPSRTTVALDGSVWVGNRGDGSLVHIGLAEENQCIDRNGNGVIETSAGGGDVLGWANPDGSDTGGGSSTAEDECILHYVKLSAGGTRHLSVDRDNNIWASGLWGRNERVFDLVDGATGEILRSEGPLPCGGYGGLVDAEGVVWSANIHRGVLRWDPGVSPPTAESRRCIKIPNYGLALDDGGNVWAAAPGGGQVRKIRGDGKKIWGPFGHGSAAAQGLAIDGEGDVWVSSAKWGGSRTVGHLKDDGTFVGNVTGVPVGSSGLAVDPEGNIWSANAAASSVTRIDPDAGPLGADGKTRIGRVDFTIPVPGASPYNYSDLMGCQMQRRTVPHGTWGVIQNAVADGAQWGTISWNAEPGGFVPAGGAIQVAARAADTVVGLGERPYAEVTSGEPFDLVGRYLQVRATLTPGDDGSTPVVSDLRVAVLPVPAAPPAIAVANATVFETDAQAVKAVFPVGLSSAGEGEISVDYATVEVSAGPGDYTPASGTLTFAPGTMQQSVEVTIAGDNEPEGEEIFFLTLENPSGGVLADALGVATIVDDDERPDPVVGEQVVYTRDDDFDHGRPFNTHHDPPTGDQLQLTEKVGTFPYLWIAASRRGTLVKIDTRTGAKLGEYATRPGPRWPLNPNPSRTTVGLDGSVWAGNRGNGTVVHVGLVEEGQCVDRNGNGVIETSTGYGNVLSWPTGGGVARAKDECILHYVGVPSSIPRHVSVDPDGNVWVSGEGGANPRVFVLIDGQTGKRLRRVGPFPCGGYGGAVDRNGILWSVRHHGLVLRWDPSLPPSTRRCLGYGKIDRSYGLAMGTEGDVYISRDGGRRIWKIDHETLKVKTLTHQGPSCAQGLAVDDQENVWISSSRYCQTDRVTHLNSDGVYVGVVTGVPKGTTGVAVDANGKIWFAADQWNRAFRIDPAAGPIGQDGTTPVGEVDLMVKLPATSGKPVANPYNYSDMTGSVALRNTSPRGTWTVIQDCGRTGIPSARVRWNTEPEGSEPEGTTITVAARSADTVASLGGRSFTPAGNGEPFALGGRFIEARVTLRPDLEGTSPVLSDLEIECVDLPRPAISISDVTVVEGDVGSVFAFFDVTLSQTSEEEVAVRYELADGSATGGADYVAAAGAVVFPPGTIARPLAVEVLSDTVDEADETLFVNLSHPTGATIADAQGLGTILDDDASAELVVEGVTVKEGGEGTVDAVFALALSAPAERLVRLDFATAEAEGDNAAEAGVDYRPTDGYRALEPGSTGTTVTVQVIGDRRIEADETFLLLLSNPIGVELASDRAVGTILDDDGDTTPPTVEITGVSEGECANAPVTPAIEVTDEHLDTVVITLDGAPYVSGTPIGDDGDHALVVDAVDTAGNRTVETLSFTIDQTSPAIEITGVAPGAVVATEVVPLIEASDLHLGAVSITLNGEPFESGSTVSAEGEYLIFVEAADVCGNSSSAALSFTIDRTPPEIEITGIDDAVCVNADVVPEIAASDPHLDRVTATLNGAPYESGTAVTAEGDHTLEVTATDAAGNSSTATLTFTIDKTPPTIEVTGIADGGEPYKHVVTPVIGVSDAHLGGFSATLSGEPFTSGSDVDVIGDYILVVSAADLCGNAAQVTVTFSVGACDLYPIALHVETLAGVAPGTEVRDIFNGVQPGNFGWLTWAGSPNVPTLVTSLTPPGDSQTYVNPADENDHLVSIGDWVEGSPGVANARAVRDALDVLKTIDLVIPVWNEVRGQGANADYRTINFARVRITDYQLPRQNRISAIFRGYERCADGVASQP